MANSAARWRRWIFSTGLAEGGFAEQRLVVAHDPIRAAEQSARRRKHRGLEVFAEELVAKLDAQDEGKSERGRRATDRGASRFQRAVSDAELTRFVKADYHWRIVSASASMGNHCSRRRFDGKLVLVQRRRPLGERDRDALQRTWRTSNGASGAQERPRDRPVFHRLPDRIRFTR